MIDQDKVKDSKTIYLAEGFATAATINIATDKPANKHCKVQTVNQLTKIFRCKPNLVLFYNQRINNS